MPSPRPFSSKARGERSGPLFRGPKFESRSVRGAGFALVTSRISEQLPDELFRNCSAIEGRINRVFRGDSRFRSNPLRFSSLLSKTLSPGASRGYSRSMGVASSHTLGRVIPNDATLVRVAQQEARNSRRIELKLLNARRPRESRSLLHFQQLIEGRPRDAHLRGDGGHRFTGGP